MTNNGYLYPELLSSGNGLSLRIYMELALYFYIHFFMVKMRKIWIERKQQNQIFIGC